MRGYGAPDPSGRPSQRVAAQGLHRGVRQRFRHERDQHTLVGERILRASPSLRNVGSIVRSTHERWDGTGYPDGLAGEEIPLPSRIIAACDAYDAMTSTRPYRAALTPQDALAELMRFAGTQFDPTVVRVLSAQVLDGLEAEHAANGLRS